MKKDNDLIIEKRDEVTGIVKKVNLLNKHDLSKEELDEIFNCEDMTPNEM